MDDLDEQTLEDSTEEENEELDSEDSLEEEAQQPDKLALLEQEVTALKNQNAKTVRDFNAAVGRYQSLMDKLESGKGDTDKLVTQVHSSIGAVEQVLETLLSDDSISPEVRVKAQEIRNRTKAESDVASLRAEIEALKTTKTQPVQEVQSEDLSPLERVVHTMINKAGYKIEDFDWAEANTKYTVGGDDEVLGYFTNKIADMKAEADAASRRQTRKTNASKSPTQVSNSRAPEETLGDDSISLDDRLATLRSMLANRS